MREYLVAWEGDFNKRVRRPYIIRYNLDIDIVALSTVLFDLTIDELNKTLGVN